MGNKQKILLRALLLGSILVLAFLLNKYGFFQKTLQWIDSFGPWGFVVFIFIYFLTCIFFFPSFIFTFAGGFLFGLLPGTILSLVGHGLGSTAALLIGRYLARSWVWRKFSGNEKFKLMDNAIGKKGWKIVALARLSPVMPFNIANYLFGLTGISALKYLGATVLGTIPSAFVYTYLGTLSEDLVSLEWSERARTPLEWMLLVAGLVVTVVLAFYIKKIAKKALEENLKERS